MRLRLFAACVVIGSPTLALAEAPKPKTVETVLVSIPLERPDIESVQGVKVLRRAELAVSGAGGLGETLSRTPGLSTTFYGAGASRPIIRGLGEDRVRVLENGVGAIDASSASPDHAVTADALDAQRIEILRGPAALAYGGNAIGGIVNVIDDSIPTRAVSGGAQAEASAGLASVDAGTEGAMGLALGAGDFAARAFGSVRDADDYETPLGTAQNSWTQLRTAGFGASALGDWGYVGAAIKRHETDYGLPPEAPGEQGGHIELEQTRIESRGAVRAKLGAFNKFDYAAQLSDYQHTEFEGDGAPGTRFENEGFEARAQAHHGQTDSAWRGVIGLQGSRSDFKAVGEESFIAPTTTADFGLFALERLDRDLWGVEGGLRLERREVENQVLGDRDFDALSASVSGFMRPSDPWFVSVTLARTERAPTAIELFADGPHLATANYERGDAALDKETALSLEFAARRTTETSALEINLYRVNFADYIALLDTGLMSAGPDPLPIFQFASRDAHFTGGEISFARDLFSWRHITFRGDVAGDAVRASFDEGGAIPRIPPHTLTLGIAAKAEKWDARLAWRNVAKQDHVADLESPTPGYHDLSARLAWRPFAQASALSFIVDGRNLTDEIQRTHASFLKDELARPGRSVRVGLIAKFQ